MQKKRHWSVRFSLPAKSFTLIELLLGLSLFSVIALTIYNVFWGGLRLNTKSESVNKIYREARWSVEQIAKDIENLVPYDFSSSYPDLLAFSGAEKEIKFILASPSGLTAIRYGLEGAEYAKIQKTIVGQRVSKLSSVIAHKAETEQKVENFIREEMPFMDYLTANGAFKGQPQVLSAKLKKDGLRFFFGDRSEKNNDDIEWKETWEKPYLPLGVRVQLIFYNVDNNSFLEFHRDLLVPRQLKFKAEKG